MLNDLEQAAVKESGEEIDPAAVVIARLTATPLSHVLGMFRAARGDLDAYETAQEEAPEGEESGEQPK